MRGTHPAGAAPACHCWDKHTPTVPSSHWSLSNDVLLLFLHLLFVFLYPNDVGRIALQSDTESLKKTLRSGGEEGGGVLVGEGSRIEGTPHRFRR